MCKNKTALFGVHAQFHSAIFQITRFPEMLTQLLFATSEKCNMPRSAKVRSFNIKMIAILGLLTHVPVTCDLLMASLPSKQTHKEPRKKEKKKDPPKAAHVDVITRTRNTQEAISSWCNGHSLDSFFCGPNIWSKSEN